MQISFHDLSLFGSCLALLSSPAASQTATEDTRDTAKPADTVSPYGVSYHTGSFTYSAPLFMIEVYDATAGEIIKAETIERSQWLHGYTYQMFGRHFEFSASRAGHSIELRTFYHSNAYVRIDRIGYYEQ